MTKRYKLRIPDGCKVKSVESAKVNGKDAIIVTLDAEFNPKPGDYVDTSDGQVGIKTKNGFFRLKGGANLPFIDYANDTQKKAFDESLKEAGLMYDQYSEDVIELPKEGDLCIFWNTTRKFAVIRLLEKNLGTLLKKDSGLNTWQNCIKFVSEEQFKKLISG